MHLVALATTAAIVVRCDVLAIASSTTAIGVGVTIGGIGVINVIIIIIMTISIAVVISPTLLRPVIPRFRLLNRLKCQIGRRRRRRSRFR